MRRFCRAARSAAVIPSAWSSSAPPRSLWSASWVSRQTRRLPMQVQEQPSVEKPSLYDRLGGVYNIATVVDDLIDRVMVDARLNANPRVDEAHHRVWAAGGNDLGTAPAGQ